MQAPWARFVTAFVVTALGLLVVAAGAIALVDPLRVSPVRVVSDEILPQTNRRYLVPGIVRGHRYDSYVIGTSTIHSLDPLRLQQILPGRFANLSLFASTPYEQAQVVRLIAREHPQARTILWGLDPQWCTVNATMRISPASEFPEWLYEDNVWDNLTHSFNWSGIDLARRKLQQLWRAKARRLRADGYLHMLPPEASFDLATVQKRIYGASPPRQLTAVPAPSLATSAEAGGRMPGPTTLREAAAWLPASARIVYVLMPFHATLLPSPGSPEERVLEDCKAAIAASALERGDWVIDAMWHSTWTVEDSNFWEAVHFRDRLGDQLLAAIDAAVNRGKAEPEAAVRILARGR